MGSRLHPFQTSLRLQASFIYPFCFISSNPTIHGVSLLSLHVPLLSLFLSSLFPFLSLPLSFITLHIKCLLCAGHDTEGLGLSHSVKTKHRHTLILCFLLANTFSLLIPFYSDALYAMFYLDALYAQKLPSVSFGLFPSGQTLNLASEWLVPFQ